MDGWMDESLQIWKNENKRHPLWIVNNQYFFIIFIMVQIIAHDMLLLLFVNWPSTRGGFHIFLIDQRHSDFEDVLSTF